MEDVQMLWILHVELHLGGIHAKFKARREGSEHLVSLTALTPQLETVVKSPDPPLTVV